MQTSTSNSPSHNQSPLLLIGPAGGGKTAACLRRIAELHAVNPIARTWVVLSTNQQLISFRHRLLDEGNPEKPVNFGVELMLFSDLYKPDLCTRIVDSIGVPPRRVGPSARRYLLRKALRESTDNEKPLEHYGSIAQTRGFEDAILKLIDQLGENEITVDAFHRAAESAKERDLARIYNAYEEILRSKDLCDPSNLTRLAVEALENYPTLGTRIDLLIIDGFDHLTPAELALLTKLAARARETIITLTYSEHRSLDAHQRFAPTYRALRNQLNCSVQEIQTKPGAALLNPLAHLETHLFSLSEQQQVLVDGTVELLAAPDPMREVQEVARRIKRLLLNGTPFETVAVLARSLSSYGPLCREVFQSFGIPVDVEGGLPLAANQAVATLMGLITLYDDEFPRARLVELLRNPYVDLVTLDLEQIDTLDRISREKLVICGREQWVQVLTVSGASIEDEDLDATRSALQDISDEQLAALLHGLVGFMDQITPPTQGSVRQYVRWIEALIGPDPAEKTMRLKQGEPEPEQGDTLGIASQVRQGPVAMLSCDIEALNALKSILAGILTGNEMADSSKTYSWTEFHQDLVSAISSARYDPDKIQAGRVIISDVKSQRGVPRDYVFLLGMAEGNFPQRPAENPLMSSTDRQRLAARGIGIDAESQSDEMSLFYETASLARKRLTISRPYLDDTNNPWPPSPYVRAVNQLFTDLDEMRIPLSHLPSPTEAASLMELGISITAERSPYGVFVESASRWLSGRQEIADAWAASGRAVMVERSRESGEVDAEYNGNVSNPRLRSIIAKWLGEGHVWSVTQFNEYGECPFKFFAKRLLRLELVEEPREGFDQLHLGGINHRILELTYRRMMELGIGLTQEQIPEIEKIFDEVAENELEMAPKTYGFRPTAWWRQERSDIRKRLWRLIKGDVADAAGAQLFKQEVRFDRDGELGPLLELEGPAGKVKVRGQIDRIDKVSDGYRVIDYKSGSAIIKGEDQAEGRNTQMQVYLLATEWLLRRWGEPDGPISGFFRHIRSRQKSGELALGDSRIELTCQIIHRHVMNGREGRFPVQPSKIEEGKCHGYCDFGTLCRH